VGPTIAFVAVSGVWYPRYLLFTTVPLLPLSAWGFVGTIDLVRERARLGRAATLALAAASLVLVLLPALRFDFALWTDPSRAPFPALDRFQYVTGWPSGYGSRDSIAFLRAERERDARGLLVVTPGPSTTASALRLLSADDPGFEVRHVDPLGDEGPATLHASSGGRPVFVVVTMAQEVRLPKEWARGTAPVFASFKPDGAVADRIYRVLPADAGR
jgi:hypothetical protein